MIHGRLLARENLCEKPGEGSYVGGHHGTSPEHSWAALHYYEHILSLLLPSTLHVSLHKAQLWVPLLLPAKLTTKDVVCLSFVASECVGITVRPRGQTVFSRRLKEEKRQFI